MEDIRAVTFPPRTAAFTRTRLLPAPNLSRESADTLLVCAIEGFVDDSAWTNQSSSNPRDVYWSLKKLAGTVEGHQR